MDELAIKFMAYDFVTQVAEKVGGAIQTLTAKLISLGEQHGKIWSGFGTAAAIATSALLASTVAIAGFGVQALKAASDFQSQMMLVRTQAHDTQDNIQKLGQAVLDLAPTVGIGPQQLAEGLYHVTSVGYRGAEAMNILKVAAMGSKVGMASLDDTAYSLTSTMTTYGLSGDKAAQTMATLNAIVGAGDMKFKDLNAAISTGFLAAGETFGVSLQSMGAALAYLTDRGAGADEAATRLKMSINLIGAPTKQSAGILKDLGLTQQEVTQRTSAMEQALKKSGVTTTQLAGDLRQPDGIQVALQDLVTHMHKAGLSADETAAVLSRAFGGGRSGTAIMSMVQHLDTLQSKFDLINTGQARFGQDFADTMSTLNSRADQVRAGFQAWEIEIGQRLTPIAIRFLGYLAGQFPTLQRWGDTFLTRLLPAVNQFGLGLSRVLPYLLPLVAAFLSLIPPMLTLAGTMMLQLAPVLSLIAQHMNVIGPLVGIIAAAVLAWNIGLAINTGLLAIQAALAGGAGLAAFLVRIIAVTIAMGPLNAATALWDVLLDANPIGLVIIAIAALVAIIILAVTHWSQIHAVITLVWNKIKEFGSWLGGEFAGIWRRAQSAVGGFFSWLGSEANAAVTTVGAFFSGLGSKVQAGLSTIGGVFSALGTVVHDKLMALIGIAEHLWQQFSSRPLYWVGFLLVAIPLLLLTLGMRFASWAEGWVRQAEKAGQDFFTRLVDWVKKLPGEIWTWLVNTWDRWVDWRDRMYSDLLRWTSEWFQKFREWLQKLPGELWNWFTQTWQRWVDWREQMKANLILFVTEWFDNFRTWLSKLPGEAKNWFDQVIHRIAEWAVDMVRRGVKAAQDFRNGIMDEINRLPGQVAQVATSLADQLHRGIVGGVNKIIGGLDQFIHGMNAAFKQFGLTLSIPDIPMVGLAGGGTVPVGQGFTTNRPTAVVGEGGPWKEYVIPTDPRMAGNAGRLFAALGQDLGFSQMGAGIANVGTALSGWGGQCVVFAEKLLGTYWPVAAAKQLTAYVNSMTARAGEAAVFTGGPYGHVAVVTGPGDGYSFPVVDSNWVGPEQIGTHVMNKGQYGFAGFIDLGKGAGVLGALGSALGNVVTGISQAALSGLKTLMSGAMNGIPDPYKSLGTAIGTKLLDAIPGLQASSSGTPASSSSASNVRVPGHFRGGILSADTGMVTLGPGLNAVYNGTGAPEPLSGGTDQVVVLQRIERLMGEAVASLNDLAGRPRLNASAAARRVG